MLVACGDSQKQLMSRAEELCRYIPDHELLEKSKEFMTTDFYAVLDTMFYRLPAHEAMDHEWLYYFVTGITAGSRMCVRPFAASSWASM